jgi:hypothetical protein
MIEDEIIQTDRKRRGRLRSMFGTVERSMCISAPLDIHVLSTDEAHKELTRLVAQALHRIVEDHTPNQISDAADRIAWEFIAIIGKWSGGRGEHQVHARKVAKGFSESNMLAADSASWPRISETAPQRQRRPQSQRLRSRPPIKKGSAGFLNRASMCSPWPLRW